MIKRFIIKLARQWVYQSFKMNVVAAAKWDDSDSKELKGFMESDTGKKLSSILSNNEAQEVYAAFNEKVQAEWRMGRVSGIASIRTTIFGLAQEKKEVVDAELTTKELDELINDRMTGYLNRRYEF
jgi:hypothetical protein